MARRLTRLGLHGVPEAYHLGVDVTVNPSPVSAVGDTVNPLVIRGSVTLTPSPVSAVGTVVAPNVVISGGGVTIAPPPASAVGDTVNPTVVRGSVTITPTPASAVGVTRIGQVQAGDPGVGGGIIHRRRRR